ncbi:hypothetical protein D3C75_760800 [compost metagenome]
MVMPEFCIIVGRSGVVVVSCIIPVAGCIDMAVDCSRSSGIGKCSVAAENVLSVVAGIAGKIVGIRAACGKRPMNRSDNPVGGLIGSQRFEGGWYFVLVFCKQSGTGLRFEFAYRLVKRSGQVHQPVLNREAEAVNTRGIAMVARSIYSKLHKIKVDIAVRIGRIIDVRSGEAVVIGFDVQRCAHTQE